MFVVSVFAHGLHGKSNADVIAQCNATGNADLITEAMSIFTGDELDADIYKGGIFLGCSFGIAALYIWAIGILAAGQSSTVSLWRVIIVGVNCNLSKSFILYR